MATARWSRHSAGCSPYGSSDLLPCLAQLGRTLLPEEVFEHPHRPVQAEVDKVVEDIQRRMILQSVVGQERLLRGLHEMLGSRGRR